MIVNVWVRAKDLERCRVCNDFGALTAPPKPNEDGGSEIWAMIGVPLSEWEAESKGIRLIHFRKRNASHST